MRERDETENCERLEMREKIVKRFEREREERERMQLVISAIQNR